MNNNAGGYKKLIIRKAELTDLENICSIHQYAFDKDHFSTVFSYDLLLKFYTELLNNNDYNYIAVGEKKSIIGFIVAGKNTASAINTFVKKNFFSLLLILLKNPKFLFQKTELMLNKSFQKNEFKSRAELRLLSIAVKKDSANKGTGTQMIRYLEKELVRDNFLLYGLSVRRHNQNAIAFYIKHNFEIEKEFKNAIYFIKKLKKND